jgi:DNA-binding transcriptional LysR family regulator
LRLGQGIKLTEEGRQFWHVKGIDQLRETFPGAAKETEFLIVDGTQSPSSSLIPEALQAFKLAHPAVQAILRTGNSPTLERMVLNSEIEVALITTRLITPASMRNLFAPNRSWQSFLPNTHWRERKN